MLDLYTVIEAIVIMLLLVLCNTYLLALYCTNDEKGFGSKWFPKALVVINQHLVQQSK